MLGALRMSPGKAFISLLLSGVWMLLAGHSFADDARFVVLVTLDGLRGEEVFGGADRRLMVKENGVEKPEEL
ncbi:MAG: hypothetical protein ACK53L_12370, partial [Pirellulaceae bacterium]